MTRRHCSTWSPKLPLEKADGTEVTISKFVAAITDDPTTLLNLVAEVTIDGTGKADFEAEASLVATSGLFVDYSSTWIDVAGTKYVIASDVFVYDTTDEDYIDLDDLEDTDTVNLYMIDGVVGFVTR